KAEFSLRASLAFRLGDNADLLVSPVAGVQTVDGVAKLFALDGASDTPADASVPWRAGGALSYLVYSDRQVSDIRTINERKKEADEICRSQCPSPSEGYCKEANVAVADYLWKDYSELGV